MASESMDKNGSTSPSKNKRRRGLTLKQAKLVKALPTAASVSEAGRIAGYSDAPTAHRALKSLREKMVEVLDRHGLTPDFAAQKCLKLINAKETKFFANKGIVLDQKEVEAQDIQMRALELWAKLYGVNRDDDDQDSEDRRYPPIVINLGFLGLERAQAVLTAQSGSGPDR